MWSLDVMNPRHMNRAAVAFLPFVSDLWRGNWGHVSDNKKLISQPSVGKKVLLITQTRHHGQTHTHTPALTHWLTTVNELWPLLYKHDWYSDDSQAMCMCSYTCVCVCCFRVPGSLGNNWRRSSINFTDRGMPRAPFTDRALVCWATIHSRCTKYHSRWHAFLLILY